MRHATRTTSRPANAARKLGNAPPLLSTAHALFIDFDGTLAELAPRPAAVVIARGLPDLLTRLQHHLQGALAIISGRPLQAIDDLLEPLRLPGAGLHGAELRQSPDAAQQTLAASEAVLEWIGRLQDRFGADPRIVVENKLQAVALHFRQAPERMLECDTAMRAIGTDYPELELIQGSMVIEARPRGADKGRALRSLLLAAPFAGRRAVVVGDDRTDEDAFVVVREFGGYGVKVGAGDSAADFRLPGVTGVHAWLSQSLLAMEAG